MPAGSALHEWTILAAREALGILLLLTGAAKLFAIGEFCRAVARYEILPKKVGLAFAVVLPIAEVALSICLILGVYPKPTSAAAAVLFNMFALALIVNLMRGKRMPCGCCGASGRKMIGWNLVARNVLLAVLCMTIMMR